MKKLLKTTLGKLAFTFIVTFIVTYLAVHLLGASAEHQQLSSVVSVASCMVLWTYIFSKRSLIKSKISQKLHLLEEVHKAVK
ncbi:hypothetical protein [Photobacterium leiognathi]|uniref:hypothetical protein n=1 Tax=Photobacterium leiognathi TaxID=553611 RepID=UPI0027397B2B|nr:hypothetical protein [Photobacterium leiognathi]